jgi:hypothetical protein
MKDSLIIRLKPGLSRDRVHNDSTLCSSWDWAPRPEFREVFLRHYNSIHTRPDPLAGPGVVVTVIGPSGFEGSAALPATPDGINALTIGRHGCADLCLAGDPTMSLRQGAVIVHPWSEGGAVRFRILDLRASRPFEDEQGRRFEALEAEGPVFLRLGAYTLFVFPRSPGSPSWSGSPESAWGEMPERVYLEEALPEPDRARLGEPLVNRYLEQAAFDSQSTLICPLRGPVFEHERLVRDGEGPHGQLIVRSAMGEMILLLGKTALTRGVLLGRYPRCDGGWVGVLSDHAISRVHALVIEIAGRVYAIDAGSSNGLWVGGNRVRVARLVTGLTVALAGRVATLEWSFTH